MIIQHGNLDELRMYTGELIQGNSPNKQSEVYIISNI